VSSTAISILPNAVLVSGAGVGPTPSNVDTINVLASTTTSAFNSETGYGLFRTLAISTQMARPTFCGATALPVRSTSG